MVGDRGGIFALLDLIEDEERRGFLEYDFRTRFQMGVDELPDVMGYDEAARLVRILRSDPSSALASSLEGWDFPVSREALALYDLFDLTVMANSDPKKPKPKPHGGRPFQSDRRDVKQLGKTDGRTREEVVSILAANRGNAPV